MPHHWLRPLLLLLLLVAETHAKWAPTEKDTFYIGNDIKVTHQASPSSCKRDCAAVVGCVLYVWEPRDGGVCLLKSHKGVQAPLPGVHAAALVHQSINAKNLVPRGRLDHVAIEFAIYGDAPLPRVPYHYVAGAQWNVFFPRALYTAVFNASERVFDPEYTLSSDAEIPSPYAGVESVGECARIAASQDFAFFTYLPSPQLCVPAAFSNTNPNADRAAVLRHPMAGAHVTMTYPKEVPSSFTQAAPNATSADACLAACEAAVSTCVGYHFTNGSCALVAPRPAPADVVAGWVHQDIAHEEDVMIRMAFMPGFALTGYVERQGPKKASRYDCGEWVEITQHTFFHYDEATGACAYFDPAPSSANKTIQLQYSRNELLQLPGHLPTTPILATLSAPSAAACDALCLPAKDNCFATVYDAVTRECVLHTPAHDPARTLAWLAPRKLLDNLQTVNEAHFFITAHQDDHELFMAETVLQRLNATNSKAVFIYVTAGDANETNGWWEARETGTLAASKAWVEALGLFNSRIRIETIFLAQHSVHKATIGNAVHYFLRLTEAAVEAFMAHKKIPAVPPVDRPSERYRSLDDIKDVLHAIMHRESNRMPTVTVATHEFQGFAADDIGVDHELHERTGEMVDEIVATSRDFGQCVSQTFYYGYQRWLHPRNMSPVATRLQRHVWASTSSDMFDEHKIFYPVWLDHAQHLGREYVSRTISVDGKCSVNF
ncbi:hypothetical protein SPRG_04831 [Saprolegnia parasitica CBS 223.65]|uniref:N-acetylglucosaminylphosphatidylinositol deacetylase n=1 Tax=Saprolegnia parasitica (strain CBS 223.65) TaxID=695850 RepID=A0A067CK80_SAPPC|nr:hypothetical protein SPRG_04831 [Saprolegnia parasitica CBS 223.65]KDO30928.1 hypothetical protein SPRG_04831 [Saprolegnia parasitica CBS 223.65]|eukprot:XP_012198619.1 hypothetical protein SPRG_04831 [Saprolegnia parasitica CBS 223.65]